jgi:hypothetical protein
MSKKDNKIEITGIYKGITNLLATVSITIEILFFGQFFT